MVNDFIRFAAFMLDCAHEVQHIQIMQLIKVINW